LLKVFNSRPPRPYQAVSTVQIQLQEFNPDRS
jgi:hypothetical protein